MGRRAASVDLPQIIEQAVSRLLRSGWLATAVSLAGGKHCRVFGWLDVVAIDADQKTLLAVCCAGPPGDEEDVLTLIRASPSARAWLTAGGQLEIWRRGVQTRPRGVGESHRQPIRIESLDDRPGPPAPRWDWSDAGLPGKGPVERGVRA
jgi:hypothetical protein